MSNEVQKFFDDIDRDIRRGMRRDSFAEWFALVFALACVAPILWVAHRFAVAISTARTSEVVIAFAVLGALGATRAAGEMAWGIGLVIGRRVAAWWVK